MKPPPLGSPLESLDTPALCIDLDAMEANIATVSQYCAAHQTAWRPHAKCHKSTDIGQKLVAAGAIGLTVAKLGEAEVMADAGITDLLIANLIVGPQKLARLVELRRRADPIVCVDHIDQAEPLSAAMAAAGLTVRVLIEVDIGMDRVGVAPNRTAVELATRVAALPGIALAGVMGYEGHLLTIPDLAEKRERIGRALSLLVDLQATLQQQGLPCGIVSCGGTGSYRVAAACPGVTEIQAGGAIFMDEFYRDACGVEGLQQSLFLIATVVGRPTPGRAIIDAGRKSLTMDLKPAVVRDRPGVRLDRLSAEHGILEVDPGVELRIGERVEIVPGYGDWTSFMHNQFYAVRQGRLEAIWPLQARGRLD
ncbi:DSD1 family PLP-dependent enzyme [Lignipirellula cremea]|uniref:D-threonine aldolase n=1 Tax=Lignipirellula cremea TaxID=2528010 RepID=A0A518DNL7_9BACT|nr:DSD1 family PLP-dependent enzyme [Lignipirellula cremea]QDU93429.1 D-threonine aldolase [Lignipirellula cremea]